MAPRAKSEEQILASLKVASVDAPEYKRAPRPSGPRVPELPAIPGLVDEVWDSYSTGGSWKIMSVPAAFVDRLRMELQAARRYVEFQHRNDETELDIRGLTKPEIVVIDPERPEPPYAKYTKHIRKGEVGVLWRARSPEARGIRARQLAATGEITRKTRSRAEYKREWRAKRKAREAGQTTPTTQRGSSRDLVMDPFRG